MRRLSRLVVVALGTVLFVFVGGASGLAATDEGEDIYYEVEVILENGSRVAVHLDESFDVVGAPTDVQRFDASD